MSKTIIARQPFVRQAVVDFRAAFPLLAQRANGRIEKAFDLVLSGFVRQGAAPFLFAVRSQSNELGWYAVNAQAGTCTCPDYPRARVCKHKIACYLAIVAEKRQIRAVEWEKEMLRQDAEEAMSQIPARGQP